MMNVYEYIEQHPDRASAIIGLNYEIWQALVKQLESSQAKSTTATTAEGAQHRQKAGGRPCRLTLPARLCLCLTYLLHPLNFELLGILFGVSKTAANDIFHDGISQLRALLPASQMEEVDRGQRCELELLADLAKLELLVDTTEQERQRPVANEEQKSCYSGKQKRHTFKSQVISLPKGEDIIDVVAGERGPHSDINLWRSRQHRFAEGQPFLGDKGYVGEAQIRTPKKKPRGGRLDPREEAQNRMLSGERIYIEHLIRRLKIFQVLAGKFRLNSERYERVMLVVCSLVRLRLGHGRWGEVMTVEKSVDVEISSVNCKPPLLPFRGKKAANPDATVATTRIPNCPQSLIQTAS